MRARSITAVCILLATLLSIGAICPGNPYFTVTTAVSSIGTLIINPDPNVTVEGFLAVNGASCEQLPTSTYWIRNTDSHGNAKVDVGGIGNCYWDILRHTSNSCAQTEAVYRIDIIGQQVFLPCAFVRKMDVSPDGFDVTNAPASLYVTGQYMNSGYGMPIIQYYDENGTSVGQITASSVADDGTWLQFAPGPLLWQYSGFYVAVISVPVGDGTYAYAGGVLLNIWGNDPPPDDGGGHCGNSDDPDCLK